MKLTGDWLFNEEFVGGFSTGVFKLTQPSEEIIAGEVFVIENEKDKPPLYVHQKVEGVFLDGCKVILKSVSCEILAGDQNEEYYPDSWEGILNSEGQIVGDTIDLNGACGVFVLKRSDAS